MTQSRYTAFQLCNLTARGRARRSFLFVCNTRPNKTSPQELVLFTDKVWSSAERIVKNERVLENRNDKCDWQKKIRIKINDSLFQFNFN